MYAPKPKPARRARVWKGKIRITGKEFDVWFGQRIGAERPWWSSSWQEAIDFATNWEDTKVVHRECGRRRRIYVEIR